MRKLDPTKIKELQIKLAKARNISPRDLANDLTKQLCQNLT